MTKTPQNTSLEDAIRAALAQPYRPTTKARRIIVALAGNAEFMVASANDGTVWSLEGSYWRPLPSLPQGEVP